MAILNRRGKYEDFDKSKMLPGEWAVVLSGDPVARDGKAVYMCFGTGSVKRMTTYEDLHDDMQTATDSIASDLTSAATKKVDERLEELAESESVRVSSETARVEAETKRAEAEAKRSEELSMWQKAQDARLDAWMQSHGGEGFDTTQRVELSYIEDETALASIASLF